MNVVLTDAIVFEYMTDASRLPEPTKTLHVVGESQFTSALLRRCKLMGVPAVRIEAENVKYGNPVVVDHEVVTEDIVNAAVANVVGEDMDGPLLFDESACAEAVCKVIYDQGFDGRNVVIVGRGRAVRGLAEKLLHEYDCTVTVCHSKTRHLLSSTAVADVIVFAAPMADTRDIATTNKSLVIDITGKMSGKYLDPTIKNFCAASEIGKLTCTILAYRAKEWMRA